MYLWDKFNRFLLRLDCQLRWSTHQDLFRLLSRILCQWNSSISLDWYMFQDLRVQTYRNSCKGKCSDWRRKVWLIISLEPLKKPWAHIGQDLNFTWFYWKQVFWQDPRMVAVNPHLFLQMCLGLIWIWPSQRFFFSFLWSELQGQ